MVEAAKVVISYAHNDYPDVARALRLHLEHLEQRGQLELFVDEQLETGSLAEEEILARIEESDVVFALLSRKYFSRSFIVHKELPILRQKVRASKSFRIFPIVLDVCAWDSEEIFRAATRCPSGRGTLSELPGPARDRKVLEAVRHLESYLGTRKASPAATGTPRGKEIVGRSRERALCLEKLEGNPLLVLYGPAGQGKTELAKYIAAPLVDDYVGGTIEIDVQNETQFGNVLSLIADRLALPPGTEPFEPISRRKHLLIFDAFETLYQASTVDQVEAFLKPLVTSLRASGSAAIITSQVNVPHSEAYGHAVKPLSKEDALSLFHEASGNQYVAEDQDEVGRFLVNELGGHPYSLIILGKYSDSISLGFSALKREWSDEWGQISKYRPFLDQKELAAAFELTFRTLTPETQMLFLALGSLPDGLTRKDIDEIWPFAGRSFNESLRSLAQRGLLDARTPEKQIFRLLGPMFQFARSKLVVASADPLLAVAARPYFEALDKFYDRFVETHAPQESHAHPAEKNQLIRRHFHNIHASLERRLRTASGSSAVSAAVSVLSMYWAYHNHMSGTRDAVSSSNDAIRFLGLAKEVFRANHHYHEVVRCTHYTGLILWLRGQVSPAEKILKAALRSRYCTDDIRLSTQRAFAHMSYKQGRLRYAARSYHKVAETAKAVGDLGTEIRAEMGLIDCYRKIGDLDAAVAAYDRIEPRLGDVTPNVRGNAVRARAYVALVKGDIDAAIRLYRQALSYFGPVSNFGEAHCRRGLADAYVAEGRFEEANGEFTKSLELYELANQNQSLGVCLVMLGRGRLAAAQGDDDRALRIYQAAADMLDTSRLNEPYEYAVAHELQGDVYRKMARAEHAAGAYEIALAYYRRMQAAGPANRVGGRLRRLRRILE
jgi:tetratricopeptide (TPR) repeat protein